MELKKQKKIKIKKQTVMRRIRDLGQKNVSQRKTVTLMKFYRNAQALAANQETRDPLHTAWHKTYGSR